LFLDVCCAATAEEEDSTTSDDVRNDEGSVRAQYLRIDMRQFSHPAPRNASSILEHLVEYLNVASITLGYISIGKRAFTREKTIFVFERTEKVFNALYRRATFLILPHVLSDIT
jgi:hypothetical protein